MKFAVLLSIMSIALVGCSKSSPAIVTVSCNATREYAKTVSQVNQRLIGSWTLVGISAGFGQAPPIPNQVVKFDASGRCLITQNGQSFGPFSYSVSLVSSFGDQTQLIPQLTVNDTLAPASTLLGVGSGQLYICEEEMVTDYGSAFDGPTHTYRRQSY